MAYEPGDVVFLPFPYRDQLAESVRPAVIVSRIDFNQRGDVIVAAVTTHPARLSTDVTLLDWKAAKLVKRAADVARPSSQKSACEILVRPAR